ncbi:hypothetical protein H072_10371 [Dactylellina haptotyla CBS 200.50]|uniref:Receptor L-domain domain-containing protein n=1 Tax=Dactylellina haptotyla (strain CBS 200.50) TaxID=1284197 RepID=S8A4V4_DACHA|nr:hypothetical protein H072_10371 [Dactylellina haptotyla CBS 200.50]
MSRISTSWSIVLSFLALLILNVANTHAATKTPEPAICDSSSIIATTPEQLLELANCTELVGDVYLNNINSVELNLFNVTSIRGMFQIHLANNTQRFSAQNLTSVGGLFMVAGSIEGGSNMEEISMPKFNSTAGLDLTVMPKLRNLAFPSRINNPNPAIRITIMNTGLESIDGLNIDYDQIQQVYFGGNPNLKDINMSLKQISVNLDVDGAGAKPNISFPNLEYLNTANIHDISAAKFPKLATMGGALGVYDSSNLTTLEMPALTQIGTLTLSVLAIANNSGLEDVIFPELQSITGGITAENNKNWRRLNGFPKLMLVTDDINMKGAYTLVEFPMLYNLTGNFEIDSSSGLSYGCKDLEKMNTDTSKPFVCDPYGANIFRPSDSQPTENKQSKDSGPLTGPKITGIAIGCLACVVVPLILFRFIAGRRRKAKLREKDIYNRNWNPVDYGSRSLPSSRAELPPHAMEGPYEMPPAKIRQELVGDIPLHEIDGMTGGKRSMDVSAMPVPDSPIERVSTGGRFDSDVSRLDSDVSSDDEYNDSIAHAFGDPENHTTTPKNMIS